MTYPTGKVNFTDFQYFVYSVMEVPVDALPADSTDLTVAYQVALATVNQELCFVSPIYYNLAVYNFGGDWLINWASDQPLPSCSTYFTDLRAEWKITNFVAGVVQSTADVSTSTSLLVPEALKNLTLSDLQLMKTPYGRMYLSIAQKLGDLWGVS